jgi:flagellar basal body-associated protein FliL
MLNFSRKAKIVIVFLAIIIVGTITAWFSNKKSGVPKEFTQAREQGALIAQNIVDLSDQSTNDLTRVNDLDKSGDYTDALTLTTNIVAKNQALHDQAVSLSDQIEIMAKSLPDISSSEARQAALDTISSRLALVSELISYSGDLEHLLVTLQGHFTGTSIKSGDVQTIVTQINTDVNAINNFNDQAQQSMVNFDTLESKS